MNTEAKNSKSERLNGERTTVGLLNGHPRDSTGRWSVVEDELQKLQKIL